MSKEEILQYINDNLYNNRYGVITSDTIKTLFTNMADEMLVDSDLDATLNQQLALFDTYNEQYLIELEAIKNEASIFGVGSQNALPTDIPNANVKIYNVSTAGTYTNFNNVVISAGDLNSGLVQLRNIAGTWTKFVVAINLGTTLTIASNTTPNFTESGFYNTTGVFTSSVNWRSSTINIITAGKIVYSLWGGTGANAISFFDSAGVYISGVAFTASGVVKAGEITIPSNATTAKISTLNVNLGVSTANYVTTFGNLNDSLTFVNAELTKKALSGYLVGETPKTLAEVASSVGKVTLRNTSFPTNGFYTPAGTYNSAASFGSVTINVTPGKIINYNLYSTTAGGGARLITFFNSAGGVISAVNATLLTQYHLGSITVPALSTTAVLSIIRTGTNSYYETTEDISTSLQSINTELAKKQNILTGNYITVSKSLVADGVTVFNTIASALTAWKTGYIIQIFDGIYEEISLNIPDGAYLKGIGNVEIRGVLANDALAADIEAKSTIDFKNSGTLENLTITAMNLRYPIHSDFGNSNATQYVINCRIIHYGTQGAYAYRVANNSPSPNAPADIWRANSAWGCGSQAGSKIYIINSYLQSTGRSFSTHNNTGYNLTSGASLVQCDDCEIISYGIDRDGTTMPFSPAAFVQSLASNTNDTVIFNNCKMNGYLVLQSTTADWREFTQEIKGSGNNTHLIQVRNTAGGSKLLTDETTKQTCFILRVKSPSASPITVSGNLVSTMFGNYTTLLGSVGINSYLKSQVNHGLMWQALNAYSGTKTITFTSGAETKTLTLNNTFVSAGGVVTEMNTQFGANSFVAELYWPGLDWYPKFTNEIDNFQNNGTTAILRGRAVKKNGFRKISLMTSTDNPSDFYAIAVQDIPVGQSGDVKYAGYMLKIWVDGLFSTTLAPNDLIKVNNDGSFSKSSDGTGTIVSKCIANENITINT